MLSEMIVGALMTLGVVLYTGDQRLWVFLLIAPITSLLDALYVQAKKGQD